MDIYGVLKKDHDAVKALLETLSETGEGAVKTREKNFEKLRMELGAHSRAEEAVVYKRLAEEEETRELVLEGEEEHHLVDRLLEELAGMPVNDEQWTAKLTVLKEQVEHHVEEEEGELFKKAKKALDKDEAQSLAETFQEQKKQHMSELKGAA